MISIYSSASKNIFLDIEVFWQQLSHFINLRFCVKLIEKCTLQSLFFQIKIVRRLQTILELVRLIIEASFKNLEAPIYLRFKIYFLLALKFLIVALLISTKVNIKYKYGKFQFSA